MGKGAFPGTDELYTGMLGMHGTKTSALALENCDLMIVFGSRFSDRVLCNADTFAKGKKIIHIEIDPAEIGKNIDAYLAVNGDLKYVISKMNHLLSKQNHSEWINQVSEWKSEYPLLMKASESDDEVLPSDVVSALDNLTDGKAIITTEVGQHQMWAAQFYNCLLYTSHAADE